MIAVLRYPSIKRLSFFPLIVPIFNTFLFIQANEVFAQIKVTSALIKQDTTDIGHSSDDTLNIQAERIEFSDEKQAKSGSLAMLLSAVVPGAGQIYAHRYYTIPLIWGFGTYFASTAIKANNQYQDYRGKYAESVRLDTANHSGNSYLKGVRDFYRNQRDEFLFYLAITYILNIVDAYVGAALYDFDVSDNLGGSAAIRFHISLY